MAGARGVWLGVCLLVSYVSLSIGLSRSLFRNKISFIENGAFYKVTKLSTLYLHNNRLQSVDQGLFKTTIHLNQL